MALAECFYNVEAARARFYPSLTISGTGAFTNSGGLGITNPGKMLWSAVASLTQPIFAKGQLVAGLRVAKDQYQQAYNTWQNSVLTAGSEVSNALVLYNASEAKSKLEASRIEVLKQNVEDTKSFMASAGSTYLEVITAETFTTSCFTTLLRKSSSRMAGNITSRYLRGHSKTSTGTGTTAPR